MGVCLYMWHDRARLSPFRLTSLSFTKVTDTLIIQFNSGWQLNAALRLWLYQCFAPMAHLISSSGVGKKKKKKGPVSNRQILLPTFPGGPLVPVVGLHGLWVSAF